VRPSRGTTTANESASLAAGVSKSTGSTATSAAALGCMPAAASNAVAPLECPMPTTRDPPRLHPRATPRAPHVFGEPRPLVGGRIERRVRHVAALVDHQCARRAPIVLDFRHDGRQPSAQSSSRG
jgi:hypothetical protein